MRGIILFTLIVCLASCGANRYLQESEVQLSKPIMSISSVFFEESAVVEFQQLDSNALIEYELYDGESNIYKEPIRLDYSEKISAKAVREGYKSSEVVTIEAVKLPKRRINEVKSSRNPNPKYDNGLDVLIDRKKGALDFNKDWLGYGGGSISYDLSFEKRRINTVVVSTLRNQGAWIFTPHKIKVYKGDQLLNEVTITSASIEDRNKTVFTDIELNREEAEQLRVEVIALESIPDWHPGAGNEPWVFIDEILIY